MNVPNATDNAYHDEARRYVNLSQGVPYKGKIGEDGWITLDSRMISNMTFSNLPMEEPSNESLELKDSGFIRIPLHQNTSRPPEDVNDDAANTGSASESVPDTGAPEGSVRSQPTSATTSRAQVPGHHSTSSVGSFNSGSMLGRSTPPPVPDVQGLIQQLQQERNVRKRAELELERAKSDVSRLESEKAIMRSDLEAQWAKAEKDIERFEADKLDLRKNLADEKTRAATEIARLWAWLDKAQAELEKLRNPASGR